MNNRQILQGAGIALATAAGVYVLLVSICSLDTVLAKGQTSTKDPHERHHR